MSHSKTVNRVAIRTSNDQRTIEAMIAVTEATAEPAFPSSWTSGAAGPSRDEKVHRSSWSSRRSSLNTCDQPSSVWVHKRCSCDEAEFRSIAAAAAADESC